MDHFSHPRSLSDAIHAHPPSPSEADDLLGCVPTDECAEGLASS